MAVQRRIKQEIDRYMKEEIEGICLKYDQREPFKLNVSIEGPINTPYYGGVFRYQFSFPASTYPFKPPKITSLQKVYHVTDYSRILRYCSHDIPTFLDLNQTVWDPSQALHRTLEYLKQCFDLEIFLSVEYLDTDEMKLYKSDKKAFIFNVQNQISEEKSRESVPQYLVFSKLISPELNFNSHMVYLDLFF